MQKRVAEMFAGVGGFRVGLENLNTGWDTIWANQWEPGKKAQYAYDAYVAHFGNSENYSNEDINKVDKTAVPDFDLLVGGFPCQDYSVASTKAKGIAGKKGVLWWDILDMISAKFPPFVFLENVDRLLSSPGVKQRGRDFGMILYTLNQLGYGVQWRMINAAEYGFPQRRRRVFIFAYRNDTNYYAKVSQEPQDEVIIKDAPYNKKMPVNPKLTLEKETDMTKFKNVIEFSDNFTFKFENTGTMHANKIFTAKYESDYQGPYQTLGDILLPEVDDENLFIDSKEGRLEKFEYLKGPKRIPRVSADGHEWVYSEGGMAFPDSGDKPGRTMLTSEKSVNRSTHVVEDKKTGRLRFIHPIEAERLNMFPDNWTNTGMPNSMRYFTMGNALVVGVISAIGSGIDDIMSKENESELNNFKPVVKVPEVNHYDLTLTLEFTD
ncbi:DNA (cytosine-5-)-methyltransferase [Leuconostoc mesenteroides subsp. mesenteroides]|uniref:DNA (cytosine-5-)-methyltransferase n=1 Tax=Leuconostoc mesenteroides TaxID=1245 RepID=UPI0009FEEF11|nr:DNA (cytosine-5-)-methyltransferase [Leuconostoc mesenteroides]ORI93726.1 DNA (cytosine-5-)-methyltransferase [Leuconostoc mesenteroides subsp. mesenteroides]